MTNEFRIFGPPGCGKTTTLGKLLTEACQEYGSENVIAASFTKTAAQELVSRDLPIDDSHVGTLHALCYRALERPKIVDKGLMQAWNESHPIYPFGGLGGDIDDPYLADPGAGFGDQCHQELNRLRGLQIPPEAWPLRIQSFSDEWTTFKQDTHSVDFTDLIAQCLESHISIPHDAQVFFLDEVQDFSPLELALARQWGRTCQKFYMAGDDDQTLYVWKGATPDAFLSPALPESHVTVLSQSYRVPRQVKSAANAWITQLTERYQKAYIERDFEGVVDTVPITYRYPVPIREDLLRWLDEGKRIAFLASCSFILDPIKHQLRDWGLPFHNPYRRRRGDWNPLMTKTGSVSSAQRLLAYRQVADSKVWWTYKTLWDWAMTLEADPIFARGAKSDMRRFAEDPDTMHTPVDTEKLSVWMPGEDTVHAAGNGDLGWLRTHLLNAYLKPMQYACKIYDERGRDGLTKNPQIILGTIHSVKGGEADIVVLFPDLSPAGMQEWTSPGEKQDSVRRCFYVGMTRAREALYWAHPGGPSIGGYL